MKFIIYSEFGEILDLACRLQEEGHDVYMFISDNHYKRIGDGIVKKTDEWWKCIGQGYTWIFDSCSFGGLQDFLREKGENVFGGSEMGDKLENNRQMGNKWFKAAGFEQPESKNFKGDGAFDEAIDFITKNNSKKWILKQNGDAPKSLNYMSKFDDNYDMLYHLKELKKSWNKAQIGEPDFDLMEVVEGLEIAASAFFNGRDFLKNKARKVVGFLNFEDKKECDGGLGCTTGEMGTTFIGVDEDVQVFKDILLKPEIIRVLRKSGFRGVFDINCIRRKDGKIVALEPTMRFGVPATSYEFIEGMLSNTGEIIDAIAKGKDVPLELRMGVGMVMCVVAPPFPVELDVDETATSINERLWIKKDGKIATDFSPEQRKHIHLYNFVKEKLDDGEYYCVATKNGHLLTATGYGKTIKETRENLIKYIKDNIYIEDMKYRSDIGARVEKDTGTTEVDILKKKMDKQVSRLKEAIKKTIYQ